LLEPAGIFWLVKSWVRMLSSSCMEDDNREELEPVNDFKYIPIYRKIPFDLPKEEWKNYIVDYLPIPYTPENAFALIVPDNAMSNDDIIEGSTVVVIESLDFDRFNGRVVALKLKDSEVTLRRLYFLNSEVILAASNPDYDTFIVSDDDLEDINIIGLVSYLVKNMG